MHLSGSADLLQRSWGRPPGLPSRAAGPAAHRLPPRPRVSARRSPTNVSAPSAPSGFDFESPLPQRSADSLTLSLRFPPRLRVSAVKGLNKPMGSISSPGRMPSAARRSPTNVAAPSMSSGVDFQRRSPSRSTYSPSLPPRLRVSAVKRQPQTTENPQW